jgi:hypothetical protein
VVGVVGGVAEGVSVEAGVDLVGASDGLLVDTLVCEG